MTDIFSKGFRLGILGGGQLGKMLLTPCMNFNILTHILDPDANAPCSKYCTSFTKGSFADHDTVYEFGKNLDLLTIEIEHVNVEALEKLAKEGVKCHPQPEVIETIQDKGLQKLFYKTHGIPTSPFILHEKRDELHGLKEFFPAMQKSRKAGYDGRGVYKIKDESDIAQAFDVPSVLEKLVDIEKEISVLVARNPQGEIRVYDAIELQFHPGYHLVEYLFSPSTLSYGQNTKAKQIAADVAKAFGIVGILAVEMFLDKSGEILVNEVAPRPHNSGHHTIEAFHTSQYEQHLRAILGLPLGSVNQLSPAAMVNLLGEAGHTGPAFYEGINEAMSMEGVRVNLYGKTITKPGRKMGHITAMDNSVEGARAKAEQLNRIVKVKTNE